MILEGKLERVLSSGHERWMVVQAGEKTYTCSYVDDSEYVEEGYCEAFSIGQEVSFPVEMRYAICQAAEEGQAVGIFTDYPPTFGSYAVGRVVKKFGTRHYELEVDDGRILPVRLSNPSDFADNTKIHVSGELAAIRPLDVE